MAADAGTEGRVMDSDGSARGGSTTAAHARLDSVLEKLAAQRDVLAAPHAALTSDQCRSALLISAVAAVQYARETVTDVIGNLDAAASTEVRDALAGLVESSPKPWGDSALNDLERISDRSARLLADIWMIGRLTVAADPQSWSNDTMVAQCLQVVAEAHLAGKLRAELEGMFGSIEEPDA